MDVVSYSHADDAHKRIDGLDTRVGDVENTVNLLPKYTPIASGTINAGDVVTLNNDGTVSVVAQATTSISQDIALDLYGVTSFDYIYIESLDIVALIGQNSSRTNCYLYIGTIVNDVITFGSGNLVKSGNIGLAMLDWCESESCIVCMYNEYSGESVYVKACTVLGTTVSFGAEVVIQTPDSYTQHAIKVHPTAGIAIALLNELAVPMTIAGTLITKGTATSINNSETLAYNSTISKWVSFYKYNDNNYVTTIGTDGSTITFNTTTILTSGLGIVEGKRKNIFFYNETNDNYGVLYKNHSSPYNMYILFFSVASGTPTLQATVSTSYASTYSGKYSCVYNSTSGALSVFVEDETNSGYLRLLNLNISNTIVQEVSQTYLKSDGDYNQLYNQPLKIRNNMTAFIYLKVLTADYKMMSIINYDSTNSSWIGVSKDTTLDGGSVEVETIGAVVTNQSGLSVGVNYYVDTDGTLTSVDNGIKIGKALSNTELLISGVVQ